MKSGVYARVRTSDKDQDPETQLMPLRDFIEVQGWDVYKSYVDMAPANDLSHRIAWRQLLDDAAKRKFTVFLVFKLDLGHRLHQHPSLFVEGPPPFREQGPAGPKYVLGDSFRRVKHMQTPWPPGSWSASVSKACGSSSTPLRPWVVTLALASPGGVGSTILGLRPRFFWPWTASSACRRARCS